MNIQTQQSATSRRNLPTSEELVSEDASIGEDRAVEFLRSLAPPSAAERTRAFAALLRAMTAKPAR